VHRTMISAWKQELVKNAKTLFERGNKKMEDRQKLVDHLHRKIGQLQVERDLVPPCAAPDFSGHEFGVKPCQEKGAWNAE